MSGEAKAFGLRTHVWIAQQIIEEISDDCKVYLAKKQTDLSEEVCESIRRHPSAFIAGALGPDAFPDLITGQVTTHPGIHSDWQTND